MKRPFLNLLVLITPGTLLLVGCGTPRMVERDRYFKPVIRHVQPMAPAPRSAAVPVTVAPATQASLNILTGALAESRRELLTLRLEMMSLRDSVILMSETSRRQRQTSLALADKVAALEQQLAESRRIPPAVMARPDPAPLARREPAVPSPSKPKTSIPSAGGSMTAEAEYQEGVTLFNRRRYDEARDWFARLLEGGIREDLADNCEYWVGECDFARGRWTNAVESFERVIALRGSNKRADALLMLGRSLEMLRQTSRARAAYERLIREYPSSPLSAIGRKKLRSMPDGEPGNQLNGPVLS